MSDELCLRHEIWPGCCCTATQFTLIMLRSVHKRRLSHEWPADRPTARDWLLQKLWDALQTCSSGSCLAISNPFISWCGGGLRRSFFVPLAGHGNEGIEFPIVNLHEHLSIDWSIAIFSASSPSSYRLIELHPKDAKKVKKKNLKTKNKFFQFSPSESVQRKPFDRQRLQLFVQKSGMYRFKSASLCCCILLCVCFVQKKAPKNCPFFCFCRASRVRAVPYVSSRFR